jgi:ribosomal protein L22
MRLVADIIRGKDVFMALNILKFTRKHSCTANGKTSSFCDQQLAG